ncbi:MAG: hypothetical protein ACTSY1_10760 [Alphaproteobacteria bacterium]
MIIRKHAWLVVLAMIAALVLAGNPAFAHRFNVALVVPMSGDQAEKGRQAVAGFMLATTERDSHEGETSDGHLGGLDVYVAVIDAQQEPGAIVQRILAHGAVAILAHGAAAIVVVLGAEKLQNSVAGILHGKEVVLLMPGQTPFNAHQQPGVAAFIDAFQRVHGTPPSAHAAQGYNAARRIEIAVRAQGSADDLNALRQSFAQTAHRFKW